MISSKIKLIDFGFDTKLFSPAAEYFNKHGHYPDNKTNLDWWKEQKKRLKKGYIVNGWKITGEHYGYLNFNKIKLTDDEDLLKGKVVRRRRVIDKKTVFPKFWDGDYVFYWCKEIAKNGMDEVDYLKLQLPIKIKVEEEEDGTRYVGGAKNLCVAKKRRFGASYKLAYASAHNYETKPKSMTILAAYDMKYLTKDGIMSKTKRAIDFYDKNCRPFRKRRILNTPEDIYSGYKQNVGGTEVEQGYLSRISAISFGSSSDAIRGQDITDIAIEESGKAPNLIATTNATIDSLSDGASKSGTIIWFGTGGGKNTNWEGFKEIFYNPAKFGALEIENQWDEGATGTYCGLFIPDYWNVVGHMSEYGESWIEYARAIEEEHQRITFIEKGDISGLVARKMEHPFCPMDAFAISTNSIFDTAAIRNWREEVERSQLHITMGNVGGLVRQHDGALKFEIDNKKCPLYDYPIKKGVDNTGAIVIYNMPVRIEGKVPARTYIIDADTYRFDSTTGDSVGAVYVKARHSNLLPRNLDNRIVAAYVGRPKSKDEFTKNIFLLAEFYNAMIGFENDEGNSLVDYAKRFPKQRLIEYLEPQFELGYDERLKTPTSMRRQYGMNMGSGKNNERIITGDEYTKAWMEEPRSVDIDGRVRWNLHTVYDLGLLREWENYNMNNHKNFDRQAAFRVMMYHGRELTYKQIESAKEKKKNSFFSNSYFK